MQIKFLLPNLPDIQDVTNYFCLSEGGKSIYFSQEFTYKGNYFYTAGGGLNLNMKMPTDNNWDDKVKLLETSWGWALPNSDFILIVFTTVKGICIFQTK